MLETQSVVFMVYCHFGSEWVPTSDLWYTWGAQRMRITAIMYDVLWIQIHKDQQSRIPDPLAAEERDLRERFIMQFCAKKKCLRDLACFYWSHFLYLLVNLSSLIPLNVPDMMSYWDFFWAQLIHFFLLPNISVFVSCIANASLCSWICSDMKNKEIDTIACIHYRTNKQFEKSVQNNLLLPGNSRWEGFGCYSPNISWILSGCYL